MRGTKVYLKLGQLIDQDKKKKEKRERRGKNKERNKK